MVIKTFNVSKDAYDEFSTYCKENGLSMSRQVDIFLRAQTSIEPKVRKEYLEKLEAVRKGRFLKLSTSLSERYNQE